MASEDREAQVVTRATPLVNKWPRVKLLIAALRASSATS